MKFSKTALLQTALFGALSVMALPSARADGLIAFTKNITGQYDIYVMNDDGTEQTRLTNTTENETGPQLSPDGSKVVFRRYAIVDSKFISNVYLMNSDGTGEQQLTTDASNYAPIFMPGGEKIGFWSYAGDPVRKFQFFTMDLDGSNRVALENEPLNDLGDINSPPAFSPDGKKIVFSGSENPGTDQQKSGLYGVDVDGTNLQTLIPTTADFQASEPDFSPDSTQVVYDTFRANGAGVTSGVGIMNYGGSGQHSVLKGGNSGSSPDYSPDGTRLAYTMGASGAVQIATVNTDGTEPIVLTTDSGNKAEPSWSGGHIVASPISIADVSVKEGSGNSQAIFKVTIEPTRDVLHQVNFEVRPDTAKAGTDYVAQSGVLTFEPGETTKTIAVDIIGNTLNEADKTFHIDLSKPVGTTIVKARAIGTILNDDPLPAVRVSDASVLEGNGEQKSAVFTLSLSPVSGQAVKVQYEAAAGGSPKATAGTDFKPVKATIEIPAGQTSATVEVPILGDRMSEKDEQFALNLKSASNAVIADGVGLGTIVNDDSFVPTVSLSDASLKEGDTGTKELVFTSSLSKAVATAVEVKCKTLAGQTHSAVAGVDYAAIASQTLSFAPGQTKAKVTVLINGDTKVEGDETFRLRLFDAVGATVDRADGVGTILDDEAAIVPVVSVKGGSVSEGLGADDSTSPLPFTITLSTPSKTAVTVTYSTEDTGLHPAISGVDYFPITKGQVTFAPGEKSKVINVAVIGDADVESDETVVLRLSGATNATVSNTPGTGVILNDDHPSLLTVTTTNPLEGNKGVKKAHFVVKLSKVSGTPITVRYATLEGTATAGSDYLSTNGTLTFAPGEREKIVDVSILSDTVVESTETFYLTLYEASGADIDPTPGACNIGNDDSNPPGTRAASEPSGAKS